MVTVRCLVQDRHRSIRQDLDQQNVRSLFAVRILEEMARYLAATVHEMSEGAMPARSVLFVGLRLRRRVPIQPPPCKGVCRACPARVRRCVQRTSLIMWEAVRCML